MSEARTPGCSYVALPKAGGGVYYAQLTSGGEIRMTGTLSSGKLLLPAAGQTWPGLTLTAAAIDITKADITGTLDRSGAVALTVPYRVKISMATLGSCTVKGTATVSSDATDPIGGGQGSAYDAATQRFAAAGASTSAPSMTGLLCALAGNYLDLSHGMGWYLDGLLAITPGTSPTRAQTATVRLPDRIKGRGRTVLMRVPVRTNAGQQAMAKVTWGTSRAAAGTKRAYAKVRVEDGKLVIRTTGKANRLYVRLKLRAPATEGYRGYTATHRWVVRTNKVH